MAYHLQIDQERRGLAERVHKVHAEGCPLARTMGDCVAMSTSLEMEDALV